METFIVENDRECGVNTIEDGVQTELAVMKGENGEEAYGLLQVYSDEKIGPSASIKIPNAMMVRLFQEHNIVCKHLGIEDPT